MLLFLDSMVLNKSQSANTVSADYDKIAGLFEDLDLYLNRLKILEKDVPHVPELEVALTEVLTSVLVICGICAKFIKMKRIGRMFLPCRFPRAFLRSCAKQLHELNVTYVVDPSKERCRPYPYTWNFFPYLFQRVSFRCQEPSSATDINVPSVKAFRNLVSGEDDELSTAYAHFHKMVEQEQGAVRNATLSTVGQIQAVTGRTDLNTKILMARIESMFVLRSIDLLVLKTIYRSRSCSWTRQSPGKAIDAWLPWKAQRHIRKTSSGHWSVAAENGWISAMVHSKKAINALVSRNSYAFLSLKWPLHQLADL